MNSEQKQFKIYGPAHFASTWAKFLEICARDGQSASELVRIWVEGYVSRKDPGNPQRPITAWVPGHEDERALAWQETRKKLLGIADKRGGEVAYWMIVEELKPYTSGQPLVNAAEKMVRELIKAGVKVWR